MIFGEIEAVAGVTTFDEHRKDWIHWAMEDMAKFRIERDEWATTAVEGGGLNGTKV